MSILLARHGETDWNIAKKVQGTTDIPLNENGKKQAEVLCQNLRKENIELKRIYSSYQKRAVGTAEIVGAEYQVQVLVVPGLEEMNLGLFEGHTWEEILQLYPQENASWYADKRYNKAPGGESYQDLLERFFVAYDQIVKDTELSNGQDILIITHGAVIMALLTLQRDLDFKTSYEVINVDNAKAIRMEMEDMEALKRKLYS